MKSKFEKYFGKDYYEKVDFSIVDGISWLGKYGTYEWEHEELQRALEFRYGLIKAWAPESCGICKGIWRKILFVGCGKGFGVLYFRNKGYDAYGIDISKYAIDNCHPDVKGYVFHEDICDMKRFKEDEFDVVASWNVLPLIDRTKREEAVRRMTRIASKYLVLRFGIEGARVAKKTKPDGYDGAPVYWEPLYYWIQLIEKFDKFRLRIVKCIGTTLNSAYMSFWRMNIGRIKTEDLYS